MQLRRFFPYRFVVLAEDMSTALAEIYAERFELTRQAWRILAVLGERGEMTARDLGRETTLEKMQVSRGLAHLEALALVKRQAVEQDRRNKAVALTAKGRARYAEIAPVALARERELLGVLTASEVAALDRIISKLSRALQSSR